MVYSQSSISIDVIYLLTFALMTVGISRGGMVQTNEQYEFVHYAVSVFDVNTSPSLSSSSSSTSTSHDDDDDDDDVCDLK